ncbi:hypothetical protein A2W24_06640 [Microgenomates group bacterium RBG_16_45_19]|nr:MAG: hypothetical protein A2W24_06640 [Microgenomates group bacterium RBG_16_45_19]
MTKIGIAQALTAFALWSSLAVFFNRVDLPVGIYISLGSILALCLVYAGSLFNRQPVSTRFTWPILGIMAAAAFKGLFWFKALQIYPVAPAMIIHNLAPLFAMLFAPLLIRERPRPHHLFAAITGLLGLTLVLNLPGQATITLTLGAILSLGAAIASGFQDVCHRAAKVPARDQTFVFLLGQALGGTLALFFAVPTQITFTDLGSIAYFGLFGALLPMTLLSCSFRSLRS